MGEGFLRRSGPHEQVAVLVGGKNVGNKIELQCHALSFLCGLARSMTTVWSVPSSLTWNTSS